jgi:peptide-methionine (S)-S-oxide reductase
MRGDLPDLAAQQTRIAHWAAERTKAAFQPVLSKGGYGAITTEIARAGDFYYAEDYHQQYLAKNPGGYCGLGGTGMSCPVGVAKADAGS